MRSSDEDPVSLVPVIGDWVVPEGWGIGEDKVEVSLRSSSCSHPFDQFGIGHRESLNAFKVSFLSLKPLHGCNDIEKPVEVEVMSVSD